MLRRALLAFTAVVLGGCSSGRDKLIADLQSARPEVRALAVKQLAEKFDSEDVGLFTQAARDPVAIVRAEAMTALGRSQDERVVDLLGEALGDSDELVQLKAAAALASFKSAKARGYLTLQYSRRGRSTRLAIVQALKGANIPGAMASVVAAEATAIWERNLKVLQSGTLPERVGAAEELGRSGRPEAVNRLVSLLKDNQVVLAAAAARGLGYAQDTRAVPALTALLDENFPELREAACEALAALGDASALPKLLAVAQEKSPASPFATAAILALPKTPDTGKALCDLALTGSEQDVLAAGREMRRRGGCPVDPVAEKLKSAAPQAALAAIAAIGPSLKELAPKVTPLLTSTDPLTRKLAVDALAELGDPSTAAAVLKAWDTELRALEPVRSDWIPAELPTTFAPGFDPSQPLPIDDPSAVVKSRTSELFRRVEALDAQRAQQAGKVLVKARPPREVIDDGTEEQLKVLASLVRALGRLKIDGARERVQPFTRDGSVSLRAAAWSALAALGEDAKEGLVDGERAVQSATAQALVDSGPEGQRTVLNTIGQLAGDRTRLLEPLRGHVPPRDTAPVLVALIKEGGAEAALAAAILGEMQASEAVPALLALLEDQTAVARREVLFVLGRLRDPRAADVVARDLYSDRAEIRAAAADAVGQLGATQQLEAVDALKGDYYRAVRDAASAAVARLGAGKSAEGTH
jgi:HEAT repeat protein